MTTPIGATGTSGTSGTTGTSGSSATTTATDTKTKSKTQLDKDVFLKLLVAQMKYQDPSKPADTTQFLSQTAQFTQVEKMTEIAEAQVGLLAAQLRQTAASYVGKTIVYTGSDGKEATGKVTSAVFDGTTPTLRVGTTDVPLSSVKQVTDTAAEDTGTADTTKQTSATGGTGTAGTADPSA